MTYVYLDPADYIVGKPISFEEYAQLVENANQAYGAGTNHGEIFATRASITTVNATTSGSAPGPYSWTVPSGITQIMVDIIGGGGGGSSSSSDGLDGSPSTISGSISGVLATANGGKGGNVTSGDGGASSGRCRSGFTTSITIGANSANPFYDGDTSNYNPPNISFFGGKPGNPATGFGNGGNNTGGARKGGGGAAAGSFILTVVPGEVLTITIGAGGAGSGGGGNGSPGMVRLIW